MHPQPPADLSPEGHPSTRSKAAPASRWRLRLRAWLPAAAAALVLLVLPAKYRSEVEFAERRVGLGFDDGTEVAWVQQGLPAAEAGVRPGDVVRALGGHPVRDSVGWDAEIAGLAGQRTVLSVERDGRPLELVITPGTPFPWRDFLADVALVLSCLAVGLAGLRRGPGYLNSRLLFYFCAAIALEFSLPNATAETALGMLLVLLGYAATGTELATELHLASVLPDRPRWLLRRPWIVPAYYIGAGLASLLAALASIADDRGLGPEWVFDTTWLFYSDLLEPLCAFAVTGLLLHRALTYTEPEGRRQAAIVLAGATPWLILSTVTAAAEVLARRLYVPGWLWAAASLSYPVAVLVILVRESRQQQRMVLELSDRLRAATSLTEVAELIGDDLDLALHPEWSTVLYAPRAAAELTLGHTSGSRDLLPPPDRLEYLRELARRRGGPFELTTAELRDLGPGEREWLLDLGPRLLVPLLGRGGRVVGVILLGEKKSGEPYTAADLQLLRAVADHVALVIDNTHLEEDVHHGRRVERQVLARLQGQDIDVVKECPSCGRCYPSADDSCASDGSSLVLTLPVERLVAGRYRLDRLLGKGGMGAVYEAFDQSLGRRVALKVLLADRFGHADALRRFEREARISARLSHPNVVTVYDFGQTDTGGAFLVMERLEGMSLREHLDRYGPLEPPVAAEWIDQVLAGLEEAHQQQIVHRDLKPNNVFVVDGDGGEPPVVKVLDFGLARVNVDLDSQMQTLTVSGQMLGTVPYMAPEQLSGGEVDERADVFAVGILAVECLTGRRPFRGDTHHAVTWAIAHSEYHLQDDGPGTAELDAVLQRCLAKAPHDRYATATAVRRALVPALRAYRRGNGPAAAPVVELSVTEPGRPLRRG